MKRTEKIQFHEREVKRYAAALKTCSAADRKAVYHFLAAHRAAAEKLREYR